MVLMRDTAPHQAEGFMEDSCWCIRARRENCAICKFAQCLNAIAKN